MAGKRTGRPNWGKALKRAQRALELNKRRIEAASGTGVASDQTLRARAYDTDPQGGAPKIGKQVAPAAEKRPSRKRRRR